MKKIKAIELKPGNIWSGSRTLAVFTNPTEIAFRKGNLKNHYPVEYRGTVYQDAERMYQDISQAFKDDIYYLYDLMDTVLFRKFADYPVLFDTIKLNGGVKWLEKCSHWVNGKTKRWEGTGIESGFIRCLISAYSNFEKALKIDKCST